VRYFKAPKESLGQLDAEAAATLIAAAADVALILDDKGVIRDVALHGEELGRELGVASRWVGRHWLETVTVESRPKVEAMLREAAAKTVSGWRQVNHPMPAGADLPLHYSAVQVRKGRIVAVGRDLRSIAALQQRLVEAQHAMERDYSRFRHVEMRYRVLFELSSEALLVVDATTHKVADANPAAGHLFGAATRHVAGQAFLSLFDAAGGQAVQALFASVRVGGRADNVQARLAEGQRDVLVSASMLRQDSTALFLVRIAQLKPGGAAEALPKLHAKLLKVVAHAPDGIVIADAEGRILSANAAFLDMAHLAAEEQTRDQPLERWLGRPGVDLEVLLANLRRHGAVRLFGTVLRTEYGAPTEVEVSGVSVMNGGRPCFGFTIRDVSRRLAGEPAQGLNLPRSVDQLKELIGRVALKDLVRETTDVIERLCIEAALELTGDNRASAAEMLGLSRQSLYVKLRRYGLADASAENGGQG